MINNTDGSQTDGLIYFGSEFGDKGSGIRFAKQGRLGEVYAIDHTGIKGSGTFGARAFYMYDYNGTARNARMYSNTSAINLQHDSGVRVTKYQSATLSPIVASDFNSGSRAETKQDIKLWDIDILDIYRNEIEIYDYLHKSDLERRTQGLVIGEGYKTPVGLINGDGIGQYQMNTWNMKAIQEIIKKLDKLEEKIA